MVSNNAVSEYPHSLPVPQLPFIQSFKLPILRKIRAENSAPPFPSMNEFPRIRVNRYALSRIMEIDRLDCLAS
jgi:hypothetical protein